MKIHQFLKNALNIFTFQCFIFCMNLFNVVLFDFRNGMVSYKFLLESKRTSQRSKNVARASRNHQPSTHRINNLCTLTITNKKVAHICNIFIFWGIFDTDLIFFRKTVPIAISYPNKNATQLNISLIF